LDVIDRATTARGTDALECASGEIINNAETVAIETTRPFQRNREKAQTLAKAAADVTAFGPAAPEGLTRRSSPPN
jgi:hypothetical protein